MPELNPRRVASTKGRFAQVTAAVLAGMAAMFCLQNVIEFRREAARPAAPPPVSEPAVPEPPKPELTVPDEVKRQAAPAPSSMLLKAEPGLGGGEVAVVGVVGEEAPPRQYALPEAPPPPVKKKERPHLQDRTMESRFASNAVRTDGRFSAIKRRAAAEPEAAPPAPAKAKEKPLAGASGIRPVGKIDAAQENLQPALIAQMTVPEAVFWTKERKINVGAALIVIILGVAYVIYASGIHDGPPERAEGEL